MRIVKVDIPFVYGGTAYREAFLFTRSPTKAELLANIEKNFPSIQGIKRCLLEVADQISGMPVITAYHHGCNMAVVLPMAVDNPHITFELITVCNPDLD